MEQIYVYHYKPMFFIRDGKFNSEMWQHDKPMQFRLSLVMKCGRVGHGMNAKWVRAHPVDSALFRMHRLWDCLIISRIAKVGCRLGISDQYPMYILRLVFFDAAG